MFTRTSSPVPSGSCLLKILDDVSLTRMLQVFGDPAEDSVDPENGYDGMDWYFRGPEGHFHVYVRFGVLRIGGINNPAPFYTWLKGQLG